jgi:hypothetical protein
MFVGHTAVALAAKRRAPRVSLGWFVAAAFGLDLLWPIFLLLGIERVSIVPGATAFNSLVFDSYPWSHSLVMACVWGALATALAAWRGVGRGTAALLGAVVVSHWPLDAVVHGPDLPLWPGTSPHVGLGLWNSVPGTLLVEGALYVIGIAIYVGSTRAKDRVGSIGLWSFLLVSAAFWASSPWSAPPVSSRALAGFSFIAWLLIAWVGWADAHRRPTAPIA